MASLIYQLFISTAMVTMGVYHLIVTTRNNLKSRPGEYSAKPYHQFPSSSSSGPRKYLQLYLIITCLFLAFIHQTLISADPDPLIKGHTPVHRFTSLQSAAVLFLFLILAISLLLSEATPFLPFPPDLFFGLASAIFFLHYSVSSASASVQISGLQAKCDALTALISALASILCFVLACQPKLFVADVGLGAALLLHGLWALQTGLSLYVEAFIPEGCNKMLDVVTGVEGSTKCDLEESRLRAVAILDLAFVIHVLFALLIVLVIYAVVAKTIGIRRFGSYEALPTLSTAAVEPNHIQMKSLTGTQA
ncbi:unnamed protein product [Rhodiola kirilowii]